MTIRKQEFYEGAALYLIARSGLVNGIVYRPPFFVLNNRIMIYLKYSTKARSPWGFTFMPDEQLQLHTASENLKVVVGLICGSDGVVALDYKAYCGIAGPTNRSLHVACFRRRGEHYGVKGPNGTVDEKIAPSTWRRLLEATRQ